MGKKLDLDSSHWACCCGWNNNLFCFPIQRAERAEIGTERMRSQLDRLSNSSSSKRYEWPAVSCMIELPRKSEKNSSIQPPCRFNMSEKRKREDSSIFISKKIKADKKNENGSIVFCWGSGGMGQLGLGCERKNQVRKIPRRIRFEFEGTRYCICNLSLQ